MNIDLPDDVSVEEPTKEEGGQLVKRYTPWCSLNWLSHPDKARSCFNYLWALGNTACEVPQGVTIRFCHSTGGSDVAWYGSTIDGLYNWSTWYVGSESPEYV